MRVNLDGFQNVLVILILILGKNDTHLFLNKGKNKSEVNFWIKDTHTMSSLQLAIQSTEVRFPYKSHPFNGNL